MIIFNDVTCMSYEQKTALGRSYSPIAVTQLYIWEDFTNPYKGIGWPKIFANVNENGHPVYCQLRSF